MTTAQPDAATRALDRLRMHVAEQTTTAAPVIALYLPTPVNAIERAASMKMVEWLEYTHPDKLIVFTASGQPGPTDDETA